MAETENLIIYFLGPRDMKPYLGHGLENSANVGHQLMVGGQDCLNGCHFIFNSILECNKRVINVKQTTIISQSRPSLDIKQSKLLHMLWSATTKWHLKERVISYAPSSFVFGGALLTCAASTSLWSFSASWRSMSVWLCMSARHSSNHFLSILWLSPAPCKSHVKESH